MTRVNVLIASGGRRNYLVEWFKAALRDLGVEGEVVVTDANPYAPALADADRPIVVPRVDDPAYGEVLRELCRQHEVGIAISVNDYELSRWGVDADLFDGLDINVIAPSPQAQLLVEDKLAYDTAFESAGVKTPPSMLGTEVIELGGAPWAVSDLIVKNRFGSGSHGLVRCAAQDVVEHVRLAATASAVDRAGRPISDLTGGLDCIVVQPVIHGAEYGVDVVSDLNGTYAGVLVREKLAMRSGETDQAISRHPEPFREVGAAIAGVTRHRGLIDTDLIVTPEGEHWLIDVNPRFGGGYPFSHLAGADVPRCIVRWHLGERHDDSWLGYRQDIAASKTESLRVMG